jgi:hypothetical protein
MPSLLYHASILSKISAVEEELCKAHPLLCIGNSNPIVGTVNNFSEVSLIFNNFDKYQIFFASSQLYLF